MEHKLVFLGFILISVFCLSLNVYAEEETSGSCSYKEKANLNKLAGSVTASYEIEKKEDGTSSFKISVYNVTNGLYVNVIAGDDDETMFTIVPEETDNGTYSFVVDDENNIIEYNMTVQSSSSNCFGDLKKIKLVKPKKNKYHDYNECKFADTENYSYCKEWITKEITLSESDVLNKIEEQREYLKKTITTSCANCSQDVNDSAHLRLINMYRKFIVIGLSIGIALDIIYIYIKVSNIRRAEL